MARLVIGLLQAHDPAGTHRGYSEYSQGVLALVPAVTLLWVCFVAHASRWCGGCVRNQRGGVVHFPTLLCCCRSVCVCVRARVCVCVCVCV